MPYCGSPKCPLGTCANIRVHGMDAWGTPQPLLYIVGSAPGKVEDHKGLPFSDAAGDLLRDMLRRMGVDIDQTRLGYVVRCAPWNVKKEQVGSPTAAQTKHCLPSLLADIDRCKPKAVLVLGSIATKALTNTRASISAIRGSTQNITIGDSVYPIVPTIDPDGLRRQGMDVTQATFLMADIKKAWQYATGERQQQTTTYDGRDYGMLTTIDEIKTYVQFLVDKCTADPKAFITADFESGGLEDWKPDVPVLGLGISHGPYQGRFIPLDHWQSPLYGKGAEVAQALAPLANLSVSNQNIKFDYQWFKRRLGITLNNIRFDTMLGHHCLFAGIRPNDLETMGGLYLQEPAWSYKLLDSVKTNLVYIKAQLKAAKKAKEPNAIAYWQQWHVLGKMGKGYAIASLEDLAHYCCIDVDVSWRLTPLIEDMLVKQNLYQVYREQYHEGIKVFGEMQYDGVAIDNRVVAELKESLPAEMAIIMADINTSKYTKQALMLLGRDPATEVINIGSPPQMACLIYDAMKMPPARMYNKSPRTTEADQLVLLLGYCKRKGKKTAAKLLEKISEWRSLDKFLGSYVESNVTSQDSHGLVHPTWNLMGTRTGRMACSDPPVHSAPTKHGIRKQFFSRWHDDGGILLGADESQIEVRIFGSLAEDLYLIDFYCNMAGADLHRYMASLLFNVPYEQVTDEQRQIAKTCVFASLYGGGASNLAQQTGMAMGKAKVIHARFVSIIAIDKFKAMKTQELFDHGRVTTPFGRILPIKLGNSESQQAHAIRQAMNTPIQSVASDIVARAIERAKRYMEQMELKSKIVIFHHDAIYWDVFPGEFFQILPLAQRVMVDEPMAMYPWLLVPLKLGIEFGTSWGAKMKVETFDNHSLTLRFKAKTDEESCYDRYYKEVVSQFEGPMGKVLQLQNIQESPREVVAMITPRPLAS